MAKTKQLVIGGLLTAFAIMIPLAFAGWLQIYIPPFSATLGTHVPSMLAMFISPGSAAIVGVGSTLGFLITLGPIVAARAFIHIIWAVTGAYLWRKGYSPWQVILAVAPIHGLGEALVVLPFGFDLTTAVVSVGIGTILHHLLDGVIAVSLYSALSKAGVKFVIDRR